MAAWIKADGYAYQQPISNSAGGYNAPPGWAVMLRNDNPPGGVWFRLDGTGGDWGDGDLKIDEPVYEPGTWVHMAFTFDSVTREINGYINGQLKGTDTAAEGSSVASTVNELRFGSGSGYSGVLNEVAIWDIALTAEDVLNVYNIGAFLDPSDPTVNASDN